MHQLISVCHVQRDHTLLTTNHNVCFVRETHTLRWGATASLIARVILVGRELTITVLGVWLVNINSTLDPLRARIAVQENFRVSSMHQNILVVIVSQARTQQTVDHTAKCVRNIRTLPTKATALVIVYVRQAGQE